MSGCSLWLLKVTQEGQENLEYDSADGFVIRAESEKEARMIAGENAGMGMEDLDWATGTCVERGPDFWNDPKLTSCERLEIAGEKGIVLESHMDC